MNLFSDSSCITCNLTGFIVLIAGITSLLYIKNMPVKVKNKR